MKDKMLELIKTVNNLENKELRGKMIIYLVKFNESNTEMECLFKEIKRLNSLWEK